MPAGVWPPEYSAQVTPRERELAAFMIPYEMYSLDEYLLDEPCPENITTLDRLTTELNANLDLDRLLPVYLYDVVEVVEQAEYEAISRTRQLPSFLEAPAFRRYDRRVLNYMRANPLEFRAYASQAWRDLCHWGEDVRVPSASEIPNCPNDTCTTHALVGKTGVRIGHQQICFCRVRAFLVLDASAILIIS